ncbi:MAG: V-type ATPase subunit [bacterium]
MSSIETYGYVNAKVRAMRSFFLTESVLRTLAAAKDLKEFFFTLSQTHLGKIKEMTTYEDPVDVEQTLFQEEVRQLRVIEKNSRGNVRRIVALLLERYDGEHLKALLREWHHKKGVASKVHWEKVSYDFPADALVAARHLDEVVALLDGTPFQKIVAGAGPAYTEQRSLFPVELAVDRDVFDRLWKAVESLKRNDRQIVRRLVGIEIDLKNLSWIGRFRHYYNVPAATVADWLLPHGFRLGADTIRRVASGSGVSEVLKDVVRQSEMPFPAEWQGVEGIEMLERFLHHVLNIEARKAFGAFPFSIGAIFGYFYLMRIETKNIRSLLQAKVYGIASQEAEALLVL